MPEISLKGFGVAPCHFAYEKNVEEADTKDKVSLSKLTKLLACLYSRKEILALRSEEMYGLMRRAMKPKIGLAIAVLLVIGIVLIGLPAAWPLFQQAEEQVDYLRRQGIPVKATIIRIETHREYPNTSSSTRRMKKPPRSVEIHKVTISLEWENQLYTETIEIKGDELSLQEGQQITLRCAKPPEDGDPVFIVIREQANSRSILLRSTSLPISCLMEW